MADLKIDFSNCDVNIEKMFDIHDNQNVNLYNNVPSRQSKSKAAEKKPVVKKITSNKPKTIKYYIHGDNGYLNKQRKRVDLVLQKFTHWGWLSDTTIAECFDALFEGEPWHCNITWKGTTTVLTILMKKLLKQKYITKQTGQSATSIVKEQFGLTPNFDQTRLSQDEHNHIAITIYLLDINNPLPQLKNGGDNEFDTSDQALQEVLSGQLRRTKGI